MRTPNYYGFDIVHPEAECVLAQLGRRIDVNFDMIGPREAAQWINVVAVRLGMLPKLHPQLPESQVRSALRAWCAELEADVIALDLDNANPTRGVGYPDDRPL